MLEKKYKQPHLHTKHYKKNKNYKFEIFDISSDIRSTKEQQKYKNHKVRGQDVGFRNVRVEI